MTASPQPTDGREALIKHMADRFLGWRLPSNFKPDAGISFKADYNEHTAHPAKHEPIGTNLFDAMQATEMVRYMLEGAALTSRVTSHDGRETLNVDLIAAAVHEGRFPDGKAAPNYCSFDDERDGGKEYCRRIARSVMAALTSRVEAPVPQPTSPSVDGREALEQIIEVANYGAKKLGEIDPAYVPGKVAGHNQNAIERFWLIVRTAKAALSAPRVEAPVAWRWRYRRDEELGRWLYNDDHPGSIKGAELEIEPLYTAPPSQPDTPARRQADIVTGAMAIARSRGHDPEEPAPLTEMCTEDNAPVPWWMVFVEESEACLKAVSYAAQPDTGVREIDLLAARNAVRDEVGSRLCHLTPHGTRICSRQVSRSCLCEDTAKAVLAALPPDAGDQKMTGKVVDLAAARPSLLARRDRCPKCSGELDTGWECNDCGFDAQTLVPPDAGDRG